MKLQSQKITYCEMSHEHSVKVAHYKLPISCKTCLSWEFFQLAESFSKGKYALQ